MSRIYESMFLLDNDVVRASWPQAKSHVTDLIAKHGGTVETARRWGERPLAYPIKRRKRATYLLVHLSMPGDGFQALNRELELDEHVLRYIHIGVDEVPAAERELTEAEGAPDFEVPEPPADDAVIEEEEEDDSDSGVDASVEEEIEAAAAETAVVAGNPENEG